MFKIKLFGVIASELEAMLFGDDDLITLSMVESALKEANGQDIDADFSSIGGLVNVGVDIFFAFRNYKRDNPNAKMVLNIKSQCASMASHIASGEFWDKVTAEDLSSWMVHNPSNTMNGDYRIMEKNAVHLKRVARLYAGTYIKRSNKPENKIKSMMDDTTFLYGQEIVDNGFADEILSTEIEKDKDTMIAQMQLNYESMIDKMQQSKMTKDDLKKAVAKMKDFDSNNVILQNTNKANMNKPANGGKNNNQEDSMTPEEFMKTDEYAKMKVEAGESEKEKVVKNMTSLIEMKKQKEYENLDMVQDRIEEAMMKNEPISDTKLAVLAILSDPANVSKMQGSNNSPEPIGAKPQGSSSGLEINKTKMSAEEKAEANRVK